MRHRKAGVKLNRTTSHRQAMFRNMVTSFFKYERIRTTDVKAKELRRWVDQIITLAKRGDLHARRQVMAIMREKNVVHKLFEEATQRFGNINGGYTRIVKIGQRPGDAAPVSLIELVNLEQKDKKTKRKAKSAETKPVRAEEPKPEKAEEKSAPSPQQDAVEASPAEGQSTERASSDEESAPTEDSPAKKEE